MKRFIYVCLLGMLCLPWHLSAQDKQDKTQDKPKTEEKAKPAIPVKVQIVFTEYDADKKISSMPYGFTALAEDKLGGWGTSLRTGVRIPIETDGKDQKTTYIDIGSNIDCRIKIDDDGRFLVNLILDRSALFPNQSSEGERLVAQPNGQPLIRQFRTNENFLLKDGQTSEIVLSTDPLNGHILRVSVSINVQK